MTETLEQRYRWLLRSYPQRYRGERGEEMLGTLMEASRAGQRRPRVREAFALVRGGLGERLRGNRHRSRSATWLGGLRLAVLFLLAHGVAEGLAYSGGPIGDSGRYAFPVSTALCALALLLAARGRFGLAAPLALVVAVGYTWADVHAYTEPFWHIDPTLWIMINSQFWVLPVAAALSLVLALSPGRAGAARHPAAWLLAVPVAALLLPTAWDATLDNQPSTLIAVALVGLLCALVDARIAIGVAGLQVPVVLFAMTSNSLPNYPLPLTGTLAFWAVLVALLLAAATVRAHRTARL